MEPWTEVILLLATFAAIGLPPILLIGACALGIRVVDDRGFYAVPPLLWLPIAAGGLLEGYLLTRAGLPEGLSPIAIWSADGPWHTDLQGLYETYLAPRAILDRARLASAVTRATWPAAAPWAIAYALAFVPVAVAAGLTWRSWRAVAAAALFPPISLTSAVVVHNLIMITCWALHWLNFWVLFVLVLLLELRRQDPKSPLLAP